MLPEQLLADAIGGHRTAPRTAQEPGSEGVCLHDHAVNLYEDEVDLVRAVALHVLDGGLTLGQRIVVVATPEHRAAIDKTLRARGADPEELRSAGDYLSLDAASALRTFMVDGRPDRTRFAESMGGLLGAVSGSGGRVRVYGEMVALLWQEGNVTGALELESLWNDLARDYEFSLLCGYPMSALERHDHLEAVRDVCHLHSGVVPPRRYQAPQPPVPPDGQVVERTEVFLRVPEAVGGVRRWLRATLGAWGESAELMQDACVVASELATNAIRHARSPFRVTLTRVRGDASLVRLAVEDLSDGQPRLDAREHEQIGGRGVHLVAQLASRWGVDTTRGGKSVWAEFDVAREG